MSTQVARLDWQPASPHLFTATGVRGTYTVQRMHGGHWLLTAVTPEGWRWLDLPTGRRFDSLNAAQLHGDWLDRQPPAGEMSGS